MDKFNLFDISLYALNLFSFMLGMTFAFFKQGLFGKKIGKYVIFYWSGLAIYFFILNYIIENRHTL